MSQSERSYGRMEIASSLDRALEHTKRMLFRPFDIAVWLSIGLMVFLESLAMGGGGGGGGGGGNPAGTSPGGPAGGMDSVNEGIREAADWVAQNLPMIALIGAAVLLLVGALLLLCLWLGSRGHMMLIRAVALSDTDIGTNWRAVKDPARSVLKFMIGYLLVVFLLSLGLLGLAAAQVVWIASNNPQGISDYLIPLIPTFIVFLLLAFVATIVKTLQRNFVSPLMFHFNLPVGAAWSHFRAVSRGNKAAIFLFLLIKMLYFVGYGIATFLVGCVTCCIGFLPVIHQAIFAPFFVFDRAFSLFMLAGLGPEYQIVRPEPVPDYYTPAPPPETSPEPPAEDTERPNDNYNDPWSPDDPSRP